VVVAVAAAKQAQWHVVPAALPVGPAAIANIVNTAIRAAHAVFVFLQNKESPLPPGAKKIRSVKPSPKKATAAAAPPNPVVLIAGNTSDVGPQ
jgi:hypothetical protein